MRPVHAVLGRYPALPDDYFVEVLLDDLVESGAWLDLELKRLFWRCGSMMRISIILIIGRIRLLLSIRRTCGSSWQWTRWLIWSRCGE